MQIKTNVLSSEHRVLTTKPQAVEGSTRNIEVLEGREEGQRVVKQAVYRNEKVQEQVNKCWNIDDGELEEGLERLQIQLMDITDTLVNVPI